MREFFVRNLLPRLSWSRVGMAERCCWHIFAHKSAISFFLKRFTLQFAHANFGGFAAMELRIPFVCDMKLCELVTAS